jgi:hypothetical protein
MHFRPIPTGEISVAQMSSAQMFVFKCLVAKCQLGKYMLVKYFLTKCLFAKCLLVMYVDQMSVGQMSDGQMSDGQMSVGQMFFDQETWNSICGNFFHQKKLKFELFLSMHQYRILEGFGAKTNSQKALHQITLSPGVLSLITLFERHFLK